jgi:hypothetical protein
MNATGRHHRIIVEGEIEVCAGCRNSLGYNVAWDQTWHERRAPGAGLYWGDRLFPSGERLI